MIELNGIYFDKIRTVKVVERKVHGYFPDIYWDVNVNGEDLGLELDKDEAEQWIKENITCL